jgi:hypothetical protein
MRKVTVLFAVIALLLTMACNLGVNLQTPEAPGYSGPDVGVVTGSFVLPYNPDNLFDEALWVVILDDDFNATNGYVASDFGWYYQSYGNYSYTLSPAVPPGEYVLYAFVDNYEFVNGYLDFGGIFLDEDGDDVDDRLTDMSLLIWDDISLEYFAYYGRFSDEDLASDLTGQSVAPGGKIVVEAGDILILPSFTLYNSSY